MAWWTRYNCSQLSWDCLELALRGFRRIKTLLYWYRTWLRTLYYSQASRCMGSGSSQPYQIAHRRPDWGGHKQFHRSSCRWPWLDFWWCQSRSTPEFLELTPSQDLPPNLPWSFASRLCHCNMSGNCPKPLSGRLRQWLERSQPFCSQTSSRTAWRYHLFHPCPFGHILHPCRTSCLLWVSRFMDLHDP